MHQTNSNGLNFHGIEWFYDRARNKKLFKIKVVTPTARHPVGEVLPGEF